MCPVGLEPRPRDLKTCALTMKPPRLKWKLVFEALGDNNFFSLLLNSVDFCKSRSKPGLFKDGCGVGGTPRIRESVGQAARGHVLLDRERECVTASDRQRIRLARRLAM